MKKTKLIIALSFFVFLLSGGVWWFQKEEPYLTVIGLVNMADGIGRQSVELIDALKDEMPINFIPTRNTRTKDVPKSVRKIIDKKNKKLGKIVIYEDCLWYPNHDFIFQKFKKLKDSNRIRIAYSIIESTRIPSEWVFILNTYFDAVAVPDTFLVEAYRDSGVRIPVFELPLGLNLDGFLKTSLKTDVNKPFVFANLSSCIDRKNQAMLIKAFVKAFGDRKDVQLIINSRISYPETKLEVTKLLEEFHNSNILFSELSLDKRSYLSLFKSADCYVSLSKSEGFSIQPREAMALGIPAIVTDNSGQSTICKSGLVKTVSSTIEEPAVFLWGDKKGSIFNCDVDEAAAALLEVYENYPKYLSMGQQAREWVRRYEYSNLKTLYKTLVKPKQVILGEENKITPDYLMTTSKELCEKYNRLIVSK